MDLAGLIAPLGEDQFFAEYWERKPCHLSSGTPGRYDALLRPQDLEQAIASTDLRHPALELARNGSYLPPELYTRAIRHGTEVFSGVPDLERIRTEYRAGATIVLPAWQRSWAPLGRLCRELEQRLDHAVHANVYITPQESAGFTPHYDTHEVLVLQIGGSKLWRVYDPPLSLPHRSQPFNPAAYRVPPAPRFEFKLLPGDLLYLPRGYVHAAATATDYSAHVTIGITVYTWIELLSEALAAATEQEELRRALPPGFASRAEFHLPLGEGLAQRLAELGRREQAGVVARLARRVSAARSPATEQAPFRLDADTIGPQTRLSPLPAGHYTLAAEQDRIVLRFGDRALALPAVARPLLQAICAAPAFKTDELPPQFDRTASLTLVRQLHREGFLSKAG